MVPWLGVIVNKSVIGLLRVFVSPVPGPSVVYGVSIKVCRYVCGRGNVKLGLVSATLLQLTTLRLKGSEL